MFFLLGLSLLILSLPYLRLGSKSTSLNHGFCVRRPKQNNTICWELDLFFRVCVFLGDCLGRWSQCIGVVSSRKKGMQTRGSAPDLKCKMNVSSFLTLPYLVYWQS